MGSQATSPSRIIALAPGRNGFQPQLNLVYSTGNGNGSFGLGWSLSIPDVIRKTSKGIPRYRDDDSDVANWDSFVLSGAEDLIPVEGPLLDPLKVTRFRLRTVSRPRLSFTMRRGLEPPIWRVCIKDELISDKSIVMPDPMSHRPMIQTLPKEDTRWPGRNSPTA